jgi:hypothetical protein
VASYLTAQSSEIDVAESLVRGVISSASGASSIECLHNAPRDVYFIGNLRSRLDGSGPTALPGELVNKLSPFAIGAELLLSPNNSSAYADVTIRWAAYYRVFPSLEQQQQHQLPRRSRGTGAGITPSGVNDQNPGAIVPTASPGATAGAPPMAQGNAPPMSRRGTTDTLAQRYRKVRGAATGRIVLHSEEIANWKVDAKDLQRAIDEEMARCIQIATGDTDRVRTSGDSDASVRVPGTSIQSLQSFQTFLGSLRTEVIPAWRIEVGAEARREPGGASDIVLILDVTNASAPINNQNVETFLFEVEAEMSVQGWQPVPFQVDLVPRGFRYSRDLVGRGFNCAVERTATNAFITNHTPIFRQLRYVTQSSPPAQFADLAKTPIPVLESILLAMENYSQQWAQARTQYEGTDPDWASLHGSEFARDLAAYESEIVRFKAGLEILRNDADSLLAFQLTNEAFRVLGASGPVEKRKYGWRLFQIVFLVSQIPGLFGHKAISDASRAELSTVDVIYFPTGGGKTEAYLGAITYHCFFDRLRGKSGGVTCWTRFPLRLLTLQQTQRMADIIGTAELIRRAHPDPRLSARTVDPFAVGYFVGAEGTPNKLVPPIDGQERKDARDEVDWSTATDAAARQRWKRVVTCPTCRTDTVIVDFDENSVKLQHRCTNGDCRFPSGILPVYVVDNEIYRYLPSVVVGTVDKLASIGNQRKFALLLGAVDGRCSVHGYYSGICTQEGCRDAKRLGRARPPGLSGPTMFVQDELHLLKEGLGTFDSHYESFIQSIARHFGADKPIKIIASSATIEQFERQVEHLYGRDPRLARIFPVLGPRLGESFYAFTQPLAARLYVGILPHNKTVFNAILELIEYYHVEAFSLRKVAPHLSDFYQTSLTYFLANKELNAVRTDLSSDTNPRIMEQGFPGLQLQELTGDTSTDEVTRTLKHLETTSASGSPADVVLATSMVSHGVDVDRLNAMIFYGMPRLTSEYIQASSRVGRSHVGISFMCFQSARERDQSHYEYFHKYHEFLGQLVEPVAINRWATYSVDRTLPGLFMGVLLQVISRRLGLRNPNLIYMRQTIQQSISTGALRAADFEDLLRDAYLAIDGGSASARANFDAQIKLRVNQFIDQIIQPGGTDPFVSSALIPSPMTSLRDVEEPIPFTLDAEGSDWGAG